MEAILLKTLLDEYYRQLDAAISLVTEALNKSQDPTNVRVWDSGYHFSLPDETTDESLWHWEETYPEHPLNEDVDAVMRRFSNFIDKLP